VIGNRLDHHRCPREGAFEVRSLEILVRPNDGLCDRRQFRLRLRDRDARLEPHDHLVFKGAVTAHAGPRQQQIRLGLARIRIAELGRQHADDRVGLAPARRATRGDGHAASNHLWIGAKPAPPQAIADDGHRIVAVGIRECAADGRLDAEQVEEVRSDDCTAKPFRTIGEEQIERPI
jgi:hypothetical protein